MPNEGSLERRKGIAEKKKMAQEGVDMEEGEVEPPEERLLAQAMEDPPAAVARAEKEVNQREDSAFSAVRIALTASGTPSGRQSIAPERLSALVERAQRRLALSEAEKEQLKAWKRFLPQAGISLSELPGLLRGGGIPEEAPLEWSSMHFARNVAECLAHRKGFTSAQEEEGSMAVKELTLVLDLDNTLLNSVASWEVEGAPEWWRVEAERLRSNEFRKPPFERQIQELPSLGVITKLRPGARDLVKWAASTFRLHVHSAGSQPYAEAVSAMLDPTGELFGGRVIGSGENGSLKTLAESNVKPERTIILDDSPGAWPEDSQRVLQVERYVFWPTSARALGWSETQALLARGEDERALDGMLATAQNVLGSVVEECGSGVVDPSEAMGNIRRRILADVVVAFSHVVPLGEEARRNPLWRLAESLGASCEDTVETCTHLIAGHAGTEKAKWASQNGLMVVAPSWLEASSVLWRRAPEHEHPPSGSFSDSVEAL